MSIFLSICGEEVSTVRAKGDGVCTTMTSFVVEEYARFCNWREPKTRAGRKRWNTNNHASAPSIETANSIIYSMDHRIHIRSRSISFLSFCCNVSSIFSLSLFYLTFVFFFLFFSFIEIASEEFLPRVGSDLVTLWNAPALTYRTCLHSNIWQKMPPFHWCCWFKKCERFFSETFDGRVETARTDSLVYWSIVVLCAQPFLACQTLISPWSIMTNNGLSCRLEIPFSQKRNDVESATSCVGGSGFDFF